MCAALPAGGPSAPAARPWWATPDGKEAVGRGACLVPRPSRSGSIDDLSVAACLASGGRTLRGSAELAEGQVACRDFPSPCRQSDRPRILRDQWLVAGARGNGWNAQIAFVRRRLGERVNRPEPGVQDGRMNGRKRRESGLRLKVAPRPSVPDASCEHVSSTRSNCTERRRFPDF